MLKIMEVSCLQNTGFYFKVPLWKLSVNDFDQIFQLDFSSSSKWRLNIKMFILHSQKESSTSKSN